MSERSLRDRLAEALWRNEGAKLASGHHTPISEYREAWQRRADHLLSITSDFGLRIVIADQEPSP